MAEPSPKPRLLLVEDNGELRENLCEVLSVAGYQVQSCSGATQVPALLQQGTDVAVVDVKLPDGNGYQVTSTIKAAHPMCEVILMTGDASLAGAAEALAAGAWAWLTKPFSTPDLLMRLEQAVRHVEAKREKNEALERARIAEHLAAAGTVTAGLSHEIRNPLNAAGLQLSVLERKIRRKSQAEQQELLEPLALARDEIRRVDRLLTEFLRLAKPESSTPQPLDLRPFLERTVALFAAAGAERNVALSCECPPRLIVRADRERLQQVVTNLVVNALEALEAGGHVRLSASALDGEEARLDVDDDGPGVPPELARRIFEPFFTTKAQGTGLGLAISHQQITQQGGTLTVARSPLGGARFSVGLPLEK